MKVKKQDTKVKMLPESKIVTPMSEYITINQ